MGCGKNSSKEYPEKKKRIGEWGKVGKYPPVLTKDKKKHESLVGGKGTERCLWRKGAERGKKKRPNPKKKTKEKNQKEKRKTKRKKRKKQTKKRNTPKTKKNPTYSTLTYF